MKGVKYSTRFKDADGTGEGFGVKVLGLGIYRVS